MTQYCGLDTLPSNKEIVMRYAIVALFLLLFTVPDAQANCGSRGLRGRTPIRNLWQKIRPHRQQAVQCQQVEMIPAPKEADKPEPKPHHAE